MFVLVFEGTYNDGPPKEMAVPADDCATTLVMRTGVGPASKTPV